MRTVLLELSGLYGGAAVALVGSSTLWYRVNMNTYMAVKSTMNAGPRRRATTTGTLVGTRFQAALLEAIDSWRKEQDDLPTRPEAVRRLVELGMAHDTNPSVGVSGRRAK